MYISTRFAHTSRFADARRSSGSPVLRRESEVRRIGAGLGLRDDRLDLPLTTFPGASGAGSSWPASSSPAAIC